jgi:hypothetical protein
MENAMQRKSSGSQPDEPPADTADQCTGNGGGRNEPSGQAEFQPIPPQGLEIASLARALPKAAPDARDVDECRPRLSVGLHRTNLGIDVTGSYFTLKMVLVRALRRSLKTAIIEVDDAESGVRADALFEINLQPPDSKALTRANKVVQRVLRARRWRQGPVRRATAASIGATVEQP